MAAKGLLVDYEWCSGCHTCEVACQIEHGYPTDQCDLCASRVEKGHVPTCVKHCQAQCLQYGDLEELSKELARKPKQMLFSGNRSE